tara:strand:- start:200 stop:589 length:390 start_codon:yes stop_codon:yes gene_type:complete
MTTRKYKDPFGRLMYNVKKSAQFGPKGAVGQKILKPDYIPKKIDFDEDDLKYIFYNKQGGKCYWLGIPLDPEWVNESYHPLALSVDRIKCGEDYIKDNIVICSRMTNVGRSRYDEKKFKDVIDYIRGKL